MHHGLSGHEDVWRLVHLCKQTQQVSDLDESMFRLQRHNTEFDASLAS